MRVTKEDIKRKLRELEELVVQLPKTNRDQQLGVINMGRFIGEMFTELTFWPDEED